ncbi:MAG: hypothetical protein RSB45_00435 [Bacilli bacterium]
MKNTIKYYYNLAVDNIRFSHQTYYFSHQNQEYILTMYNRRPLEEAKTLYLLNLEAIVKDKNYHRIILNKENSVITVIENIPYVLIKLANSNHKQIDIENLKAVPIKITKDLQSLSHFNWVYLWSQKIDYIEYQIEHIKLGHLDLMNNIWYYIGLGENAISYIQNTVLEEKPTSEDGMTISHRRINFTDDLCQYYNPLSLIIDHPSRDYAEYLKSYFLSGSYSLTKLEDYLESILLSQYGYRLLFGRLLFPSFYFDAYEKMIDKKITEKSMLLIAERGNEYKEFLVEIYHILKKHSYLPEVTWLIKKI